MNPGRGLGGRAGRGRYGYHSGALFNDIHNTTHKNTQVGKPPNETKPRMDRLISKAFGSTGKGSSRSHK